MITVMKKSTKGFYTLEAAIFLPFVILAVLSLGYFIRIEGTWENCIHGAVDESAVIAARSCNGVEPYMTAEKVRNRILEDNPKLDDLEIRNVRIFYSDLWLFPRYFFQRGRSWQQWNGIRRCRGCKTGGTGHVGNF